MPMLDLPPKAAAVVEAARLIRLAQDARVIA
jgi:hypothetical protein